MFQGYVRNSAKCENTSEVEEVWVAAKQALIAQLEEQIKDDEIALDDENKAVDGVKKCVQSAVAAGLEARQQVRNKQQFVYYSGIHV